MNWTELFDDIEIGGVILAILIVLLVIKFLRSSIAKFGFETLFWRYVSGHHHHGQRKTDAGWFTKGTRVYGNHGHASRWEYMPRAYRAAYRLGVTFGVLALIVGLFAAPVITLHLLFAFFVFGVFALTFVSWNKWQTRTHRHQVIAPLASAIANELKVSRNAARRFINIPPENLSLMSGVVGYIELPEDFEGSPARENAITRVINSHLPIDAQVDYQLQGASKRAVISIAGQPPQVFPWNQAVPLMEQCERGQVLLGLDRFKKPYYSSFNVGEDPHWGFYCAPGRGKSTQLAIIAAQILHQDPDARVIYIDPKSTSVAYMEGIPGLTLLNDPGDIHAMWNGVAAAHAEMERRRKALKADPTLVFPRLVLMIDELNRFTDITKTVYRKEREPGSPTLPDVFSDLAAVLWQGREFNVNVVVVGQRLDDRSVGMSGLRDALGFRGLSGFKNNAWNMFIGSTPVPRSQQGTGRWIYVKDDQQTWVQNTIGTKNQIREYALTGRVANSAGQDDATGTVNDLAAVTLPFASEKDTRIIGVREAAKHLGLTVGAFTSARYRHAIPGEARTRGNYPSWAPEDLEIWQKNRPKRVVDGDPAEVVDSESDSKEPETNPSTEG